MRHFDLEDPSLILHIGDDPEKDFRLVLTLELPSISVVLRAAKSFGAKALLFDPKGKHKDTFDTHDRLEKFSDLRLY